MKKFIFTLLAATMLLSVACNDKKSAAGSESQSSPADTTQAEAAQDVEEQAEVVTLDGISMLASWDMGAMSLEKKGDSFILKAAEGPLQLQLKPTGNGTYEETSGKRDMIGQSDQFIVRKVGDVITLAAYNDKRMEFSLVTCKDLKDYRRRGYYRMLSSRFEPIDGKEVRITETNMDVPILPESPQMSYFFVEDGKGDLTNTIRLSPGRFHLSFDAADKGVKLHFCKMVPNS